MSTTKHICTLWTTYLGDPDISEIGLAGTSFQVSVAGIEDDDQGEDLFDVIGNYDEADNLVSFTVCWYDADRAFLEERHLDRTWLGDPTPPEVELGAAFRFRVTVAAGHEDDDFAVVGNYDEAGNLVSFTVTPEP